MRLVLTREVTNLGQAGDVVEVAPGYGRNYLIPQGLAVLATPAALNQRQAFVEAERKRRERILSELKELAARIEAITLEFEVRVGEHERLYGSVTSADVGEALERELGEEIDKRKIDLPEPIKELGTFDIPVHLGFEVKPTLKVVVKAEEEPELPEQLQEEPELQELQELPEELTPES